MKTTTKALVGGIALAIVVSASFAAAETSDCLSRQWIAAAVLGESGTAQNAPEDKGKQAADLLRRARQAMAENDLGAADSLIAQAEALGVQYGMFFVGDTPKKARRDLERKRNAEPAKPSRRFASAKNGKAPTADPFAGRSLDPPTAAEQVTPLPKVDSPVPVHSLSAAGDSPMQPMADPSYRALQPGENDARPPAAGVANAASQSPLRTARLALAVGDVRRAVEFVQRARAMQTNYQPTDDTPDKVENAIRKFQELSGVDKNTEAYARAFSRNMMEQADGLARWGDLDEAERLAGRAASLRLTYGPFEPKPQDMLQRLAEARRQRAGHATATSAPGFAAAGKAEAEPGFATAAGGPSSMMASRQKAVALVHQAREALAAGQYQQAEQLARQADGLHLPDAAFAPGEDRPALVLLDLQQLKQQGVVQAGAVGGADRSASSAVYDPANDPTRNVTASNEQPAYPNSNASPRLAQNGDQPVAPAPPPTRPEPIAAGTPQRPGMALFLQGEAALKARDTARAREFYRQAANYPNDLDPVTAQRLQDRLQLLSGPAGAQQPTPTAPMANGGAELTPQQQILVRQVAMDLANRESKARALRDTDPKTSLAMLEDARRRVETAGLDNASRDQLLRRVDRAIGETRQLIEQNRPRIELAERNNRIREEVERRQRTKVEVQEKLAMKIDLFNKLMDEQRYAEAEVVAKQAAELDPNNPVVTQVVWQAKFVRRFQENKAVQDGQEEGFIAALGNCDKAAVPFDDNNPITFPNDGKDWKAFSQRRGKYAGGLKRRRTEREIEIERKLRTPVSLQFTNAPLSKVMDYLAKLAEVNLYLDPKGLAEEGVTTDTPVTIDLRNEIMLKSALNLILDPLHLSYVVKDEVLKITSEQMRDGQVYTVTYNVADLVIPIPNFVPGPMGLQSGLDHALSGMGFGGASLFGSSTSTPMAVVAGNNGKSGSAAINPSVLAQAGVATSPHSALGGMPKNAPVGSGPGGLGGGAQADFDSLIDLITSTVKPSSWDSVGGAGSIAPFQTNLSLVVSQTQEVHEEIVDLLEQLRRLQDLQVTIEVRFITLNDNFFERIGVDFDFNYNTMVNGNPVTVNTGSNNAVTGTNSTQNSSDPGKTVTVGLSSPDVFNANLDIPFSQNSYALAVPQFGGFDATAGASLGFAILSDIEAYFFINAAQGDKRSNVLQAPKVTLFNGQQAFVSDTSQSPFVISVIPVVGDFAAAQQPVIVVLSEGTFMTVQAVISNDRRFVRLTVVPFFSKIGAVNTFQFTGTTTTTASSTRSGLQAAATDPAKLWNSKGDNASTTNNGTTVQLPTFSYVTVTTTVSVPDGGTVLLGGIKRLSEGRSEFGVPMLDKLPYINRLFKNVGIGRETQSLMMMVTPRIIIQEEEEEKLGVQSQP